jgi:hypothetical protein
MEFLGIVETHRTAEVIGDDPPVRCDNRKSRAKKTFSVRGARTWRRQCVIQTENMRAEGTSASVGFSREITAKVEQTLQQTVRNSYSRTNEVQETYEQSVDVEVPAGVLELVTLTWKKIWQHGYIKIRLNGFPVEAPFEELVGVGFDIK